MDLFVYGTLMVPSVMHAVCGYAGSGVEAVLPGFRRRLVRGEVYPAILPWKGESVAGLLYLSVSHTQLLRLDEFEGDLYRREAVDVMLANQPVTAQTYVICAASSDLLSDRPWKAQTFVRQGLDQFMRAYPGFARGAGGQSE